jgi:putative ABC transport system ATP-binding protein
MITLDNVSKVFQLDNQTSITPVCEVSLTVEPGEFLMIVGRSGSGKTTLLNLCAGLVKPTLGRVLIDGHDIQELGEKALSALRGEKIGFVFQAASMLPSLSVLENVAVPAMFGAKGCRADDYRARALELLDLVGIGDRKDALPRQLSGGEARRVAIARALMNKPDILIADEPTSDLDAQTELNIVATLQKTHASGVTTVVVTHNLDLIPFATRALRMDEGRLLPLE